MEISRLEQQTINERVTGPTPWVSTIQSDPKQNNSKKIIVCVDMRKANKAFLRERHSTSTIDEVLSNLNGSPLFSKIDLKDRYHQLTLRYIRIFSIHLGLFRYRRLSFGMKYSRI